RSRPRLPCRRPPPRRRAAHRASGVDPGGAGPDHRRGRGGRHDPRGARRARGGRLVSAHPRAPPRPAHRAAAWSDGSHRLARRPILGPGPDVERLWYATGHGRSGILLAALTGEIIADLLTNGATDVEIGPLGVGRFNQAPSP